MHDLPIGTVFVEAERPDNTRKQWIIVEAPSEWLHADAGYPVSRADGSDTQVYLMPWSHHSYIVLDPVNTTGIDGWY